MKFFLLLIISSIFCLFGCTNYSDKRFLNGLQLYICGDPIAENYQVDKIFLEEFCKTPLGKREVGGVVPAVFSLQNEHIRISLYDGFTITIFKCKKKKNENFQLDSLWQFRRKSTDFEKALYQHLYKTFMANKTPEELNEIRKSHLF